jgi:S-adenosylmethionine uptake transporter
MYTQFVWGTAFGFALFGDRPGAIVLIGSAVIVASGLYTLWHESGVSRAPVA